MAMYMGGIEAIVFAILFYGAMLLTPFCLIGLAACTLGMLVGKWDSRGFRQRWNSCWKMVIGFCIPIAILGASLVWLDYQRTFPNGYKLVYMHSNCCNMVAPNSVVVIDKHIIENSIAVAGDVVSGRLEDGEHFTLDTNSGTVRYQQSASKPNPDN